MNITTRLTTAVVAIATLAFTQLSAEVREWSSPDGTPVFKAELVNAYGDTAYFQKEDGGYVQVPLGILAKYDVAYIINWARARDTQPATTLFASLGSVAKKISTQWPSRIKGDIDDDKENISNIVTPKIFTFLMVKHQSPELTDLVDKIAAADKKMNAGPGHMMEVMVVTPLREGDFRTLRFMLGKHGGSWLMPNEWGYNDKKDLWTPFWRAPGVSVLVLDENGTILCDSAAKSPDGKFYDPVEFLDKFTMTADNIRAGKGSVQNPLINQEAFNKFLAEKKAQKYSHAAPVPVSFDFSGLDPVTFALMDGHDYVVTFEVGTDGFIRNLTLKSGGDATTEAALKQASALWFFEPVFKDGAPVAKKIGVPLKVRSAPAPDPASK
jgi:hypothetical protein